MHIVTKQTFIIIYSNKRIENKTDEGFIEFIKM